MRKKKGWNPFRKITTREAKNLAYRGKAITAREIGEREAYIAKTTQAIEGYVGNGLMEEAKPLAQNVANAEKDRKRLLREMLAYDRLLGRINGHGKNVSKSEINEGLKEWLKEDGNINQYADDMGELLDCLNESERTQTDADYEVDQIHSEQNQYSDRAEVILQKIQTRVNARRDAARAMEAEAEGEETQEAMPV